MERPLALHISALSEPEYQAYSCIINELLPDQHGASTRRDGGHDWENTAVPIGEARGWIRGKYGVDAGLIDQILRLFPASHGSVKLPQFFAILRLISHARYGQNVDKALVFVQAPYPLGLPDEQPARLSTSSRSSIPTQSLPPTPQSAASIPPRAQSVTGRTASTERIPLSSNPFRRSTTQTAKSHTGVLSGSYDDPDGRLSPTSSTSRPVRTTSSNSSINVLPRPKKTSNPELVNQELFTKNPFLTRTNSHALPLPVNVPPLPPRKPAPPVLPPPRHPAPPGPPPPKPPAARNPSHTHTGSTSVLIRQSLLAAKTAQKASESTLQQLKTMEVIKSSSQPAVTGTLKERARGQIHPDSSTSTPPLTVRSGASPSPVDSVSSQDHGPPASVSTAPAPPPRPPPLRGNSRSSSPAKSPIKPVFVATTDERLVTPSPESSSAQSTSSRPARSKSLHASGAYGGRPPVPTPPPRRPRPESVQAVTSPFAGGLPSPAMSPSSSPRTNHSAFPPSSSAGVSRRASVQHARRISHSPPASATGSASGRASPSHGQDPFSAFIASMRRETAKATENMFGPLRGDQRDHPHGGPDLHKFARKAEGGLAPGRGYISHRGAAGERLVPHEDDAEDSDDNNEVANEQDYRRNDDGRDRRAPHADDPPTVDSDTPGMDMNSPTDEMDWNEWEPSGDDQPQHQSQHRQTPKRSNTSPGESSFTVAQRQAALRAMPGGDDYRAQRVDGWSRLG